MLLKGCGVRSEARRVDAKEVQVDAEALGAVRGPANVRDTHKLPFEPVEMDPIIQACHEVGFRISQMKKSSPLL